MGFFSELKSDLSQAAKTIMPEDSESVQSLNEKAKEEAVVKPKTEAEVKKDLNEMLDHLDEIKLDEGGATDNVEKEESKRVEESVVTPEPAIFNKAVKEEPKVEEPEEEPEPEPVSIDDSEEDDEPYEAIAMEEDEEEDTVADLAASLSAIESIAKGKAEEAPVYEESAVANYNNGGFDTMDIQQQTPTDETASITEGMRIVGNLETTGSLDLIGKVTGNVTCLGKLNVTGEVEGDSRAAEIYAEAARITGEVRSNGSVKIGQSTVVIGNIFATSAVIAGAVKGDIDVPGPVVLDTTAIVMGNIKSQSVQINNGAVIEGNCSQAYAEVNPSAFFDGLKGQK
ncbi:polymer-forming cytoskeletal protein [Butyrivibrio sp. LC3010]|uniref:polymer-forming cytoskeletal protein n=1 Tax=Butyrivibrio sp. LC3010 TaxID=1280680 RepID=UPI0004049FD1|nr:polymer-forming cytoskeletal protein [Butyrivibrio sp. LC3010]